MQNETGQDLTRAENTAANPSVYLYTFHKCASSLFSSYILNKAEGLKHIDYERMLFRAIDFEKPDYQEYGCIYGPIRLYIDYKCNIYNTLVAPVTDLEFIREKTAIFMLRDPRDMLVSEYYSFGFSHSLSKSAEIRQGQEMNRKKIRAMTIDEYALSEVEERVGRFELLYKLIQACEHRVVLHYEDMLTNWGLFAGDLIKYLDLSAEALTEIYLRSRPREKIVSGAHRRSGKTCQYKTEFKPETISCLNEQLAVSLKRFNYMD